MLQDIKKDCVFFATQLGDYQAMDVDTLANGYCDAIDAKDTYAMNMYLSALVLRFWYTIDKMYKKSQNIGLEREDFFAWLVEAINYACKYRAWRDTTKKTNAQSCINKCIHTIRLQHYYEYNLDKSRANFSAVSLNATITPGKDSDSHANTLEDTLLDEAHEDYMAQEAGSDVARSFVQSYVNNNKLVEAIILDTIAFTPSERIIKQTTKTEVDGEVKKSVEYYSEFWAHRLIQNLSNLDIDYDTYFTNTYRVNEKALAAAIDKIRTSNNQRLYRYLRKCLAECKASLTSSTIYA